MDKTVLTVIVSTYNRSLLVCRNMKTMLRCHSDRIEFVVGDNASTDDTVERLKGIDDRRVRIVERDNNFGIFNTYLLWTYATGRYVIVVNDRDYISGRDLDELCEYLQTADYDFISLHAKEYPEGQYLGNDRYMIMIGSRHPGTLLWKREFFCRYFDADMLRIHATTEQDKADYLLGCYLCAATGTRRVYQYHKGVIHQPGNRETIRKNRAEVYGDVYISLGFAQNQLAKWEEKIKQLKLGEEGRNLLLVKYEDLLNTVTEEYYRCLCKPGFAKRNHCEYLNKRDWLKNGISFYQTAKKTRSFHGMETELRKIFARVMLRECKNHIKKYVCRKDR
ncbi:MAG: glycosyltransferase family 2 protein [Lachnospiraceae bacterium]